MRSGLLRCGEGRAWRGRLVGEGLVGGLLAGLLFALTQMMVATSAGAPVGAPWRLFASVLLGEVALAQGAGFGVYLVGAVVHLALSALFGVGWGLLAGALAADVRERWGAHLAAAMLYGMGLYLLNFQLVARLIYPWFLGLDQAGQIALHVFAYGLPLGLYAVWRLRPATGRRVPSGTAP
jgi:hypothetical protein